MSSNNNKNLKESNFKPKFNFNWVYGALAVLLIVSLWFNNGNLSQREISQNRFESILNSNDISDIVIVNRKTAQLYIKEEAQSKSEYKKITSTSFFNKKRSNV